MIIPSIKEIFNSVLVVNRRFVLSILAALFIVVVALILNHGDLNSKTEDFLGELVLTAIFAFPFIMGVDLFSESKKINLVNHWILRLAACAIVVVLYFYLFRGFIDFPGERKFYELIFLNAAAWSFFTFSAFIAQGKKNAFWQFLVGVIIR